MVGKRRSSQGSYQKRSLDELKQEGDERGFVLGQIEFHGVPPPPQSIGIMGLEENREEI
jgi:hypothetical protein